MTNTKCVVVWIGLLALAVMTCSNKKLLQLL